MKLLQGILGLYAQRADWFAGLLLAHIGLALTAIAMSGMIGLLTASGSRSIPVSRRR